MNPYQPTAADLEEMAKSVAEREALEEQQREERMARLNARWQTQKIRIERLRMRKEM